MWHRDARCGEAVQLRGSYASDCPNHEWRLEQPILEAAVEPTVETVAISRDRHIGGTMLLPGTDRWSMPTAPSGYPADDLGLLAPHLVKDRLKSNLLMLRVDLAFWKFAATQRGLSTEDNGRIRTKLDGFRRAIKDGETALCQEIMTP
jgi:hypothetical protein